VKDTLSRDESLRRRFKGNSQEMKKTLEESKMKKRKMERIENIFS
jgi:hypothetical protein